MKAKCCVGTGGVLVLAADGKEFKFAGLPLDILKAAYDAVLIRNEKAELSIRGGAEEDPRGGEYISNINLPGYWSVYYFGDTEEKPLGLVMYQADLALGDLAFGQGELTRGRCQGG